MKKKIEMKRHMKAVMERKVIVERKDGAHMKETETIHLAVNVGEEVLHLKGVGVAEGKEEGPVPRHQVALHCHPLHRLRQIMMNLIFGIRNEKKIVLRS